MNNGPSETLGGPHPRPLQRARRHGRRYLQSRVLRQGSGFVVASLAASVIGGVITVVLARLMTVDHYAVYSFSNSVLGFTTLFFEFGLLVPASRRLSTASPRERAGLLGAATTVMGALAIAFSLTVFALSFVVDQLFSVHAGSALRVTALVAAGWSMAQGCLMLAQGVGRIGVYSVATVASKALYLAVIVAFLGLGLHISPVWALVIESSALLVAFTWMLARLRPAWIDIPRHLRELVREARAYGFAIYVGRVLAIGTYNMDVLMLGWFARPRDVAFYALAGAIAAPVSLASTGLSTALFGSMAQSARLRRSWLAATIGISIAGVFTATALAYPFVHLVLGQRYATVIGLVPILALAQGINGVTRLYNSYLWSHARGKDLRTASIALTVTNVILNFALIPTFGAAGAAWASVLALVVNLALHIIGYRRTVAAEPASPGGLTSTS